MEKKCWNCSEPLEARARFCHNCGKSTAGELQKSDFLTSDTSSIPQRKKAELQLIGSEMHAPADLSGVGTDITGAIRDDIDNYLNPDVVLQPMVMRKAEKQRPYQDLTEGYNVKGESFAFTDKSQSMINYAGSRGGDAPKKDTYQYYEEKYRRMHISSEKPVKDKVALTSLFLGILALLLLWVPALPIIISVFALLIGSKSKENSSINKISRFINIANLVAGMFVLITYISSSGI